MSRIHGSAPLIDNDATQGRAMNSTHTQASILAVDDDTRSLMALQGLLADMSLRVVTAKSGDEALRCVLKQDFAVILMDARMPGVDGFEAARLIRERERSRHTPIIFLTSAYEDTPSVTRGYEALERYVAELGLELKEALTRCIECNSELESRIPAVVAERVPPYVRRTQSRYSECPECGRIYWAGTHWQRMREVLLGL